MLFIKILFLSLLVVVGLGSAAYFAVNDRTDIHTQVYEFIGAWILGISLWMEERVACYYAR